MPEPLPPHLNQLTPGAALLGREFLGFDPDGVIASIRFLARPDFANRHGSVLGGFLAAMLDSATGLTLLTRRKRASRRAMNATPWWKLN